MSKTCSHCHLEKPLDAFNRRAASPDGRQPRCKACVSAYGKQRYAADPGRFKGYEMAKRRAAGVAPKRIGRDPDKVPVYQRRTNAKRYGLTVEQYDEMIAGGCDICGVSENIGGRRLAIDHCHTTGKVRGALCHHCNAAIGHLQDSTDILRKALAYLE